MIVSRLAEYRPRFLNLFQIRFPVGAIVSIGHRVAGVILLSILPLSVIALEYSLGSAAAFERLRDTLSAYWLSPLLFVVAWSSTHHVLGGLRHMLMDIGIGYRLDHSRASARAVIAGGLMVACGALVWWLI